MSLELSSNAAQELTDIRQIQYQRAQQPTVCMNGVSGRVYVCVYKQIQYAFILIKLLILRVYF